MNEMPLLPDARIAKTVAEGLLMDDPHSLQSSKRVIDAFGNLPTPSSVELLRPIYHVAVTAAARHQLHGLVDRLVGVMRDRGMEPNVDTHRALAVGAVDSRVWPAAIEVVESAVRELGPAGGCDVLRAAVERANASHQGRLALKLMYSDAGRVADLPLFKCAMATAWKLRRRGDVRRLLAHARHCTGEAPTTKMFALAIHGGCGGKVARALHHLDLMVHLGVSPDATVYSAAIWSCAKRSRWRKAKALVLEMRECGIPASPFVFAKAMQACGRAGEWSHALQLLDEMGSGSNPPPNLACFTVCIEACRAAGKDEQLIRVFEAMVERGVTPTARLYGLAMMALTRVGRHAEVLERHGDMLRYLRSGGAEGDSEGWREAGAAVDLSRRKLGKLRLEQPGDAPRDPAGDQGPAAALALAK